jgi:hypothetical protein
MVTLHTFDLIVICLGSCAVGWVATSLAIARDNQRLRASLKSAKEAYTSSWDHRDALEGCLKDLATASIEDGQYIDELEADVLELTNKQMELRALIDHGQCSTREIQAILEIQDILDDVEQFEQSS